MDNEVIVSIVGIQNMGHESEEPIEMITVGKYFDKGNKKFITYIENGEESLKDTLSTIKIEKDKVTLSRVGDVKSHMIFDVYKKHFSRYPTPFGELELGITTRQIIKKMEEDFADIKINYLLEVNNEPVGVNDLHIKVTPKTQGIKLI